MCVRDLVGAVKVRKYRAYLKLEETVVTGLSCRKPCSVKQMLAMHEKYRLQIKQVTIT